MRKKGLFWLRMSWQGHMAEEAVHLMVEGKPKEEEEARV
jgi:hypothetical protein